MDLIINPEVRDVFLKRATIIKEFRRVLEEDYGYLEVDTPILTTIAGGANARPFDTHHNTLDIDMKLRISNELFLKRCIVGGLDRVYEMGKMFRNEGMDRRHNPEFTNMECYAAYQDMDFVMEVTERMVYKAQMAVNGTPILQYQGKEFDVTPPWRRLNMADAIKEITGVDLIRSKPTNKQERQPSRRAWTRKKSRTRPEVRSWRKCLRNTVRMFRAIWTDRYLSSAIRWRFLRFPRETRRIRGSQEDSKPISTVGRSRTRSRN